MTMESELAAGSGSATPPPSKHPRWEDSIPAFEKVSLNLTTLCGAIPLDNFLANNYDGSIAMDYAEFEVEESGEGGRRHGVSNPMLGTNSRGSTTSAGDDVASMDVDGDEEMVAGAAGGDAGRIDTDDRIIGHSSLAMPAFFSGSTTVTSAGRSSEALRESALGKLHKACNRLSGTAEALHFEYIEDNPSSIQCILTVTIPTSKGPSKRSYSTTPSFSRRSDAKGEAAVIAVNVGVLDFINSASSPLPLSRDKLAPFVRATDVHTEGSSVDMRAGEESIRKIDQLCAEWRLAVKAEYTIYRNRKDNNQTGCALRIALTSHAMRIYSTSPEYPNAEQAKAACAILSMEEGVSEYIMYGNGQKVKPDSDPAKRPQLPPTLPQLSLQEFFDALPRPFIEPIDETKGVSEISWSNVFNMIIQGAKLNTLRTGFYFSDVEYKSRLSGCVLRVTISDPSIVAAVQGSPGEASRKEIAKTYIVDPCFVKSSDAKNAACILAITQNLRGYLADIYKKYSETKQSTREFDKMLCDTTLRTISKLRPGKKVAYDVFGASGMSAENSKYFGCTFIVDVSPDEGESDLRKFAAPAPYVSKAEAKNAAVLEAAQQGVVELLLTRSGRVLPECYRTFWDTVSKGDEYQLNIISETGSDDENTKTKKQRLKRKRQSEKKKAARMAGVEGALAIHEARSREEDRESGEESGEVHEPARETLTQAGPVPGRMAQSTSASSAPQPNKKKKRKKQHPDTSRPMFGQNRGSQHALYHRPVGAASHPVPTPPTYYPYPLATMPFYPSQHDYHPSPSAHHHAYQQPGPSYPNPPMAGYPPSRPEAHYYPPPEMPGYEDERRSVSQRPEEPRYGEGIPSPDGEYYASYGYRPGAPDDPYY